MMTTTLTRKRTLRAARQDPAQVAKIIQVQERQIEALQTEVRALEGVLMAVAYHYVYDHISPTTGEVRKGYQL